MKHFKVTLLLTFSFLGGIGFTQTTCSNPITITAGQYSVDTIIGTDVPFPVCAPNGAGSSLSEWFEYTPTSNYTIIVSADLPINAGGDTRLHIYTGSCAALSCHAGDDDSGTGYLSVISTPVLAGITYLICFDNRWSAKGFDFVLEEHPYVAPLTPPISFTTEYLVDPYTGHSFAAVDMNGDYLDDLVSVSADTLEIHYQNANGGFTYHRIGHDSVPFEASWSVAAGDYDKNGFNDLLYGGGTGVTFLKANHNGTQFEVVSTPEYVFSQRSHFIDIDNDGHLDAFVSHDVDPNVYYMNDGNGNLQFNQGGIGDHPEGGYYGSIWVDYDNDGDMDLFIAKCRGGQSTARINELLRNDGGGVFTNVSVESNMADSVQTWSSAWNDYDNDGDMDAIVGASSTVDGSHKFMRNNGDGTFTDITAGSGWDVHTALNVEHASYDFDNDGFADVFGGGGIIMFNNGDMTFSPVQYGIHNGSIGDFNNDGFLDIRHQNIIYYNSGNTNNWLKINLKGIESNSNGIGARIEIYGAWGKQIREIRSGVGFKYMNSLNAHFGIGAADEIDSLIVWWPSGTKDKILNPTINSSVLVVEGSENLSTIETAIKTFKIYPNPTTNTLTFENMTVISVDKLYIVSELGQIVKKYDPNQLSFDVSNLPAGMYVFIVEDNFGKKHKEQFIKR